MDASSALGIAEFVEKGSILLLCLLCLVLATTESVKNPEYIMIIIVRTTIKTNSLLVFASDLFWNKNTATVVGYK